VRLEPRPGPLTTGLAVPADWAPGRLRVVLTERGLDDEVTRTVVENLDAQAAGGDLEQAFARVPADLLRRPQALAAMAEVRTVAGSLQRIEFPPGSALAQRVLWPALAVESNGMEDARFVRFTAPNGAVDYRATYTAHDGRQIAPRLLTSPDLRVFTTSPLTGPAARNKGMALFPRLLRGRHVALCRSDGETTSVATSPDGQAWETRRPVHLPRASFEVLQVGNCGSPLETPAGWLVLTHGVDQYAPAPSGRSCSTSTTRPPCWLRCLLADLTVDLDGVIATSAASHSARRPFGPPRLPPSLGIGGS